MYCKNCGQEFDAPYRWYSEEWDEDYVQCPYCHSEEIWNECEEEEEEEEDDNGTWVRLVPKGKMNIELTEKEAEELLCTKSHEMCFLRCGLSFASEANKKKAVDRLRLLTVIERRTNRELGKIK